ncbi:hypothetical protein IKG68_02350 [Candidatus Saccharibacteria bacterium]|nr:hypothetical protein [Candidatus Saccharibacteria bacterium]
MILGYTSPNHPVTVGDLLDSVEESKKDNVYSWADVKKEVHEKYSL